ncbi:MAG: DUF4136 domain-containing protein [Bacteroidales bacterium]|nr:DUF4136 domain-containing protein [Bacteroidales bacterium]
MKKNVFYLLGIIFIMVSCYPDGPEYYEDLDVVYTNYSEDFDFNSNNTFAMPDKIVKIEGNLIEGEDPEFVQEPINSQLIGQIESNMTTKGWTKVEDPANADLVLFPAVVTNTTVVYYYDYWCWYYPYYCGWGYYYPVSVSSYTTGTLIMSLVADGENYVQPSAIWYAAANGIMTGEYNTSRVTRAIDQAFEQSPYLDTK